jgi:hypothetical protein
MKLNPLGSTDHRVSLIGIGLAALGRPGYINIGHADDLENNYDVKAMEARAHAVLKSNYVCTGFLTMGDKFNISAGDEP